MANVTDIVNGINTRIQAVLTDYSPLDYLYAIEKNNYQRNSKRFGTRVAAGLQIETTLKKISVGQTFSITLTDFYKSNNNSDSDKQAAVLRLSDDLIAVMTDIIFTKIGLPDTVLNTELGALADPIFIEESNVVIMEMDVTVSYRNDI